MDYNQIFKSELNENQKRVEMVFGKLLINLRKNNYMKIYSLMSGVSDKNIVDNVINLVFADKTAYEMLNNKEDIESISTILKTIEPQLKCELKLVEQKTFDEYKFVSFLKSEFSNILTIK